MFRKSIFWSSYPYTHIAWASKSTGMVAEHDEPVICALEDYVVGASHPLVDRPLRFGDIEEIEKGRGGYEPARQDARKVAGIRHVPHQRILRGQFG